MTERSQFGRREFFVRAGVVGAAVVLLDAVDLTDATSPAEAGVPAPVASLKVQIPCWAKMSAGCEDHPAQLLVVARTLPEARVVWPVPLLKPAVISLPSGLAAATPFADVLVPLKVKLSACAATAEPPSNRAASTMVFMTFSPWCDKRPAHRNHSVTWPQFTAKLRS